MGARDWVLLLAAAVLVPLLLSIVFPQPMPPQTRTAIVVGSGLAGLSAASELIAHNVPVQLLERAAKPGGNSIKASSGINGVPTRFQPANIQDSVALFHDDTVKSAGAVFGASAQAQRQKLISTLTASSASAISWLVDDQGVDLSHVAQLGGHSLPRTHRGAGKSPPPGFAIVNALLTKLKASPLFTLETSCVVTKVLAGPSSSVTGVEVNCSGETKELHGPVVFASGGFGGDAEGMLAQYRPDLAGFPSTNDPRPGSQALLTAVGAQLLDMEQVQVHPTGFVDPKARETPLKFLAAEVLRGEGGVLLREGKRFVDEMTTRLKVTAAIMEKPPAEQSPKQWNVELVLDEGAYEAAKSHIDFYLFKGLMRKATVGELGTDALDTIKQYAEVVAGRAKDGLGRSVFGQWKLQAVGPDSVVYVGAVTPVVHFTMGGVVISERAEVLDAAGTGIAGVWAAGEVTGGVHGENRLGGSSLLECVVFGRIAGQRAAQSLQGR